MKEFDPNDIANVNNNIFGLPYNTEDAKIVIIPVPWDVTVSYGNGTSLAPDNIFKASAQVDLYDDFFPDFWKKGIAMEEVPLQWLERNNELRRIAEDYIDFLANGGDVEKSVEMRNILFKINEASEFLHKWVERQAAGYLNKDKIVAVLGGEHSCPLGLIKALANKYDNFGILHIDAHSDLRNAYEGFTYSHASVMYNVLQIPEVSKLVQIGIRDYCEDELNTINNSNGRVKTYFDRALKESAYEGKLWKTLTENIIDDLPDNIYISFDVDGLDPKYCPNTGTPVPGGMEFEEIMYLLKKIVLEGKKIIGFDICETGYSESTEWDANVAARILYRLSVFTAKSNKL
ncbi:MAG: agmatinase family protein [Bacteroidota bacterium]|nr:agmatinase family protein [Bacteroidota bacterium]